MQKNWRELIIPKRLELDAKTASPFFGKFACEPLERGFGITIGNALRRILLSSLQGAAITTVRIDGVLHEFSSIAGVREDVTDIILNLKEVRVKLHGHETRTVELDKVGEGTVTAGDFNCPPEVEILNPEQHIASLSKDSYVNIMDQYRPVHKASQYPRLNRGITPEEFNEAIKIAKKEGLHRFNRF